MPDQSETPDQPDTPNDADADVVAIIEGAGGTLAVELELDDFLDDSGEGGEVPHGDVGGVVDGDRITYDASPWAAESRTMLTSLLQGEGVAHAWQGTEVTVHAADEDLVDRLVAEVLAVAAPAFDPSAPKVVYEVGGWSDALQTELVDALVGAEVPFEWDAHGDLVVLAEDEARVEELLDALPDSDDDPDAATVDGLAVHEVLDQLFVAADRLGRRPGDARATVNAVAAAERLAGMATPFGFDESSWGRLVDAASALGGALAGDRGDEDTAGDDAPATDEAIATLATSVRELVAQYV
ncbi:MAG: hypothetical protein ACKOYM_03745 [Actinomycetes bacterium]